MTHLIKRRLREKLVHNTLRLHHKRGKVIWLDWESALPPMTTDIHEERPCQGTWIGAGANPQRARQLLSDFSDFVFMHAVDNQWMRKKWMKREENKFN